MGRHRPNTVGYLKEHNGKLYVGATDNADPKYHGPEAEITFDDTWLNICTDPYEGRVMMNIEALPFLRNALAKIERQIKSKSR